MSEIMKYYLETMSLLSQNNKILIKNNEVNKKEIFFTPCGSGLL